MVMQFIPLSKQEGNCRIVIKSMCIFLDEACVISSIFLRSDLQDFKIVGLPLHFLKFCDLQLIELLGKSLFFTRAMTLLF